MNKPTVEIRLALPDDLEAIMPIFDAARSFMAATGNPNQWISGYPQRELILREIQEQHCYVCLSAGRGCSAGCWAHNISGSKQLVKNQYFIMLLY